MSSSFAFRFAINWVNAGVGCSKALTKSRTLSSDSSDLMGGLVLMFICLWSQRTAVKVSAFLMLVAEDRGLGPLVAVLGWVVSRTFGEPRRVIHYLELLGVSRMIPRVGR